MKIGLIGSYDVTHQAVCGQSDKTELFESEFRKIIGTKNVTFVNTYAWRKRKIRLMMNVLFTFLISANVVIMTSVNGTKLLYVFASFFKKVTRKNIYHVVIGGKQNVELLKNNRKFLKIARQLDGIYVEVKQMVNDYHEIGIKKVMYIPNCKAIVKTVDDDSSREKLPLRFCTYSKINKEKGIPEAIEAVAKANTVLGYMGCTLDIFGVVDEAYKHEFEESLKEYSSFIQFRGKIQRENAPNILNGYYAMLFPTHHPEGVPGAMIDAYEAGLPIIAFNTYYISNIIIDGHTGILIPENDNEKLVSTILWMVKKPEILREYRLNCRTEAMTYDSTSVIHEMITCMELR